MSKAEQLRKHLEEERRKNEAFELAREQELKEKERKEALLAAGEEEQQQVGQELYFTASPNMNQSDWEKIVADYKKKYPDQPIKEDNVLIFPTREDAINFFQQQAAATPPRKFLGTEIDESGKPTGFYVFSCGDGTLYQGSLNEIQDKLKEAQKENPDDPNIKEGLATIARALNPAQDFRAALKETKNGDEPQSTAPNPLGTKPRTTPL